MKAICLLTTLAIIAPEAESTPYTTVPSQSVGKEGIYRQKRAGKQLGRMAYAALNALERALVGTKKLPPKNKCCKDFIKHGDVRKAWRDFDSLRPTDVLPFQQPGGVYGKSGEIGSMTIMVRSSGIDKKPVIELINRDEIMKDPRQWSHQDPPIYRITYTN